ncbi:hypothetical protein CCR80_01625 [Rhodothalassium salexigens]|uniref:hypothetical protein n=1 Tax=Rhodothalassium salexigens TaxID=1086 RepID=UPI00191253C4|nr:hypothetical protein [Rhodothalassium salexigens]MBK5919735.1 hypothetical protein [Rhodothalassium salexigens]
MTINWAFIGKAMGVYVALPAVAVFNGVMRDAVMLPALGPLVAEWLGTATGIALVYLAMAFGLRVLREPRGSADLWLLGAIWLVLTVGVEIAIGALLGMSAAEQWAAYRIWEGRAWPLMLVAMAVGPRLLGARPGQAGARATAS